MDGQDVAFLLSNTILRYFFILRFAQANLPAYTDSHLRSSIYTSKDWGLRMAEIV